MEPHSGDLTFRSPPPPVKDQGPYKVSRTGMIPRALERYLGQLGHWRSGGNDC